MDTKINILHFITSLNIGGTEKYLLYITKALKDKFNFFVGYIKQEGPVSDELRKEGIQVYRLNNLIRLCKFLKKNRIHLLHTHLYRANIIGRISGKLAETPVIISGQQSIDGWKKFYHILLDRWTTAFTDCIIANSQTTKDLFIKREKIKSNKIYVVYNGVNTKDYIPRVPPEVVKKELKIDENIPLIGYIGRLHYEKGIDYIPEIISRLKKYVSQFKFVVVGEGPLRNGLLKEIEDRQLSRFISLLSWKENILDIISVMDLIILPSREESFPQIILEAMLMAKPVVACDVGGVKEILTSGVNGIIVPPGDLEAFTQAIYEILQDKNRACAIGEAGKRHVIENFSMDKMIQETEQIYNNLLNDKIK